MKQCVSNGFWFNVFWWFQVAVDGATNNTSTKFEVPAAAAQEKPAASEPASSSSIATAASVFMADVANLIKYVPRSSNLLRQSDCRPFAIIRISVS